MRRTLTATVSDLVLVTTACGEPEPAPRTSVAEFCESVMSVARSCDSTALVEKLTAHNDADLVWLSSRSGKPISDDTTTEEERKGKTLEGAKLWLASYEDLFDSKLSSWSYAKVPSGDATEVGSLIMWVEHDAKYHGILVAHVAKVNGHMKAIGWVTLSGLEAYYGMTS